MAVTFSAIIIVKGNKIHIVNYHTCNGLSPQSICSKKTILESSQILGHEFLYLRKFKDIHESCLSDRELFVLF